MSIDPVADDELLEQRLVEPAWRLHVDVLSDRRLAQAGELEPGSNPLVLTVDGLAVDHHRNALLEGERGDVGLSPLVFQCLGHAGDPPNLRRDHGSPHPSAFSHSLGHSRRGRPRAPVDPLPRCPESGRKVRALASVAMAPPSSSSCRVLSPPPQQRP
jgi:hypothetical protein